ncbi:futalosine hydrolase [Halalkalibacter urbisdiaboli]|uniref:futalosine hydrolase n=1 Tax=Halalkalibacter urbisdiaboli TaxID=1960589 RepID=UPI000B432A67|nr:futalosine hydrolase [Halalkalibacter urbisdiaboli]
MKRILIMTSVRAEQEAVERGLGTETGFEVAVAGVGLAQAAATTAAKLAVEHYDLVINAGIAGGFVGRASIGSIVVANEIIAADLGAETAEGFRSLEDLKLGYSWVSVEVAAADSIVEALKRTGLAVGSGPILTLSTVTGTANTAEELLVRHPNAVAEAMEGFGVAVAAKQFNIPVLEIRTISNLVGPRDREAWRLKEALVSLELASSVLAEVLR